LQTVGATLQKQVGSGTYNRRESVKRQKAEDSVKYFEILALINASAGAEFTYLAAETLYSAGSYDDAMKKYEISRITRQWDVLIHKISSWQKQAILQDVNWPVTFKEIS